MELADDLLAMSARTSVVNPFAGAKLDLTHVRSRYPCAMVTPQTNVDQALGRYAADHGVDVHWGIEVFTLR